MTSSNNNIPRIATAASSGCSASFEHACIINMSFEDAIATLTGKKAKKKIDKENE